MTDLLFDIEIDDDAFDRQINDVVNEYGEAIENALEKIGLSAERFAKENCPVDTGRLRNDITHVVDCGDKTVYIGTNVEYGVYVEMGTGRQATEGGNPLIAGQRPQPFLKPAATEHGDFYRDIIKKEIDKV